ncbi:hypothetical protein SY88_00220 [Clostridiales bacterium PH28_bin88]|nr:hypothetical protein SY88_00220 [Clostridiales bacterium PH28_bin88]
MKDLGWLQKQVGEKKYLVSRHANQRMRERDLLIQYVLQAIAEGHVLETQTKKGDKKLLLEGRDDKGIPFYVVVALSEPLPIIVTVCRFDEEVWQDVEGVKKRRRS